MAGSSIKTRIVPAAAIFARDVTNTGDAVVLLVTKKVHQNLPLTNFRTKPPPSHINFTSMPFSQISYLDFF